jgi:type I restriction enzyme R subunit
MTTPSEHKTVQARILKYAQEIGWTYAPLDEAERRRGFDQAEVTPEEVLPQRNAKENAR